MDSRIQADRAILKRIDDQLKLGGGYDHNWILNHEAGVFSLAAAAIDEESGRKMEVYTDLPGVQFYTGNFLDGQVPGKGGVKYARRQDTALRLSITRTQSTCQDLHPRS